MLYYLLYMGMLTLVLVLWALVAFREQPEDPAAKRKSMWRR